MYQARLQKIATIPLPSAIPPEQISLEVGQTIPIKFPCLPLKGRGFFLYKKDRATYTSAIQKVWSPTSPGDVYKIHGITINEINADDVVFVTENTIYVLRNIEGTGTDGQKIN